MSQDNPLTSLLTAAERGRITQAEINRQVRMHENIGRQTISNQRARSRLLEIESKYNELQAAKRLVVRLEKELLLLNKPQEKIVKQKDRTEHYSVDYDFKTHKFVDILLNET